MTAPGPGAPRVDPDDVVVFARADVERLLELAGRRGAWVTPADWEADPYRPGVRDEWRVPDLSAAELAWLRALAGVLVRQGFPSSTVPL